MAVFLFKAQEEKFLILHAKHKKILDENAHEEFFVFYFLVWLQLTSNLHYFRHSTNANWSLPGLFYHFHFILLFQDAKTIFHCIFSLSSFYRLLSVERMTLFDFSASIRHGLDEHSRNRCFTLKWHEARFSSAFYLLLPFSIFLLNFPANNSSFSRLFVISATSASNWLPFARLSSLSPFFI